MDYILCSLQNTHIYIYTLGYSIYIYIHIYTYIYNFLMSLFGDQPRSISRCHAKWGGEHHSPWLAWQPAQCCIWLETDQGIAACAVVAWTSWSKQKQSGWSFMPWTSVELWFSCNFLGLWKGHILATNICPEMANHLFWMVAEVVGQVQVVDAPYVCWFLTSSITSSFYPLGQTFTKLLAST